MKTNMKRYAPISLLAVVVLSAYGFISGGPKTDSNIAYGATQGSLQAAASTGQDILIAGGGGDGQESHGGKGGGHSHG